MPPGSPSCWSRPWRCPTARPRCASPRARSAPRPRPWAGGAARDVLLLGAGPMAVTCVQAAERLADQGIGVTVVDPRWIKPLDEALVDAAREHRLVATVEDNGRVGGFGDAVCRLLRDHEVDMPARTFGLPQEFLEHAERGVLLEDVGLAPQHLARAITEAVARLTPELAHGQPA